MVLKGGLQCVIVVFQDHTRSLFYNRTPKLYCIKPFRNFDCFDKGFLKVIEGQMHKVHAFLAHQIRISVVRTIKKINSSTSVRDVTIAFHGIQDFQEVFFMFPI